MIHGVCFFFNRKLTLGLYFGGGGEVGYLQSALPETSLVYVNEEAER